MSHKRISKSKKPTKSRKNISTKIKKTTAFTKALGVVDAYWKKLPKDEKDILIQIAYLQNTGEEERNPNLVSGYESHWFYNDINTEYRKKLIADIVYDEHKGMVDYCKSKIAELTGIIRITPDRTRKADLKGEVALKEHDMIVAKQQADYWKKISESILAGIRARTSK